MLTAHQRVEENTIMAGKLKVAAVGCGGIGHRHQLGYLHIRGLNWWRFAI